MRTDSVGGNYWKEIIAQYSTYVQAVDLSMMFLFKSIVTTKHINALSTSNY